MSEHPVTLTDRVRALTGGFMNRLGAILHQLGIHPDLITILGLGVVLVAAILIADGQHQLAGVILLLGLPLDAVDGAVARAMGRTDSFGAMLDSSLDRYADGLIFAGLSYYFAVQDNMTLMVVAQAALLGSFMVSYARARAEGLGVDVKVGWFTRMERVIVILALLLVPQLLEIGVWVLAIGTNLTGMQRIWFVYKMLVQADTQEKEDKEVN